MPLLADTIVETARRTLTNAIRLADNWGRDTHGKWRGARVIYGDTDSVFVKLPGRSVREAFQFGEEFCAAVTASNPPPVQLKLEKVYLGSIMRTVRKEHSKHCGVNRAELIVVAIIANAEKELLRDEVRKQRSREAHF
jgi:DNA polymerase zeta